MKVIFIKLKLFEKLYDYFLRSMLGMISPVKKSIVKTKCLVHTYINNDSLLILRNEKFFTEYELFDKYRKDLNKGVVWADQDFKSSNHFYNPYKRKGLYGRKNAMDLGLAYYNKSLDLWKNNKNNDAMFYLGAAIHIIQDMTIPQHANIRLLDNHRQYESFVKKAYQYVGEYQTDKGAYRLSSYESFIRFNARVALKIYKNYSVITDDELRFFRIAKCTLPLAIRTTAGALLLFCNTIKQFEK